MKTMIAKYPGVCCACSKPIHRGETINFFGRGRAEHAHGCQAAGPRKPDGPCWICQNPEGFFRNLGAATPVWCDACDKTERAKTVSIANVRFQRSEPDRFDMQVEDNMRDACGL